MTVSVSSKGIRTDTDCPDCEVLIRMNDGQAKTIDELSRDLRRAQKQIQRLEAEQERAAS